MSRKDVSFCLVFHAGVRRVFGQDIEFFRALCRHFKKAIGLPLVK